MENKEKVKGVQELFDLIRNSPVVDCDGMNMMDGIPADTISCEGIVSFYLLKRQPCIKNDIYYYYRSSIGEHEIVSLCSMFSNFIKEVSGREAMIFVK